MVAEVTRHARFRAAFKAAARLLGSSGGRSTCALDAHAPTLAGTSAGSNARVRRRDLAADVHKYATHIAGTEIGYAIGAGATGAQIGAFDFKKLTSGGLGKAGRGCCQGCEKVVTSKVMQSAAKGLGMIAPALGPLAPAALAVSGGIGVAGKLLGAKTAQDLGAPLTAMALATGAVGDAKALTGSLGSMSPLLRIANDKANAANALTGGGMSARRNRSHHCCVRDASACNSGARAGRRQ